MSRLIRPALPSGTLAGLDQPRITAADSLVLRPWKDRDATALCEAYRDGDLQHWSARRIDSQDEALENIARWHDSWAAETDAGWAVVPGGRSRLGRGSGHAF